MIDWNPKFTVPATETRCASVSAGDPAVDSECELKVGGLTILPPSILSESAFRSARIRAFREAISHDDFETTERIQGTVDRLLALLNQVEIVT